MLAGLLALTGCPGPEDHDTAPDDDTTGNDDGDDDMADDDSAGGPRTIRFAGLQWRVKSGVAGPRPDTHWSDSHDSVWVDDDDRLHLTVRLEAGIWTCAEVYSTTFTRHGVHRFYTVSRLDQLDPNVVFAPFLYRDDETEVDIEFSRWGSASSPTHAQYVVQPYGKPGNLVVCRLHRLLDDLDQRRRPHPGSRPGEISIAGATKSSGSPRPYATWAPASSSTSVDQRTVATVGMMGLRSTSGDSTAPPQLTCPTTSSPRSPCGTTAITRGWWCSTRSRAGH